MTTKQKILLVVRFVLFTGLWYVLAQIVLGLIYGFVFFEPSHDPNTSVEEQMVAYFEGFVNSPAPIVIFILSLVIALGISTLQTLSKIRQYRQAITEN